MKRFFFRRLTDAVEDLPLAIGFGNTVVKMPPVVKEGRENFAAQDEQREEASKTILQMFQGCGKMIDVKHLVYVGEKGWIFNPSKNVLTPTFKNMMLTNGRQRYPNLQVITLGACQSALYAEFVSTLNPDTYVIGFVPPLLLESP